MLAEQKAGGYSTKYRFTGKEVDEETGLYYFGARYYDARNSLWYGVDPKADQAPDWNPYRYGFNNPIRMIDPNGMSEADSDGGGDPKKTELKKDDSPKVNLPKVKPNIEPSKPVPQQKSSEKPKSNTKADDIWKSTLVAAAVTSQLDSPLPGPGDLAALAELLIGGIAAIAVSLTIDNAATYFKQINGNDAANEAAKEWGFENAHDLKNAHGADSDWNIYRDGKTGEGVLRRRDGKGEDIPIIPNK